MFAYVNHAPIRSWNQPVLSNEGKVSYSRKEQGPLLGLKLTTDWHPPTKSQTRYPLPHAVFVLKGFPNGWLIVYCLLLCCSLRTIDLSENRLTGLPKLSMWKSGTMKDFIACKNNIQTVSNSRTVDVLQKQLIVNNHIQASFNKFERLFCLNCLCNWSLCIDDGRPFVHPSVNV